MSCICMRVINTVLTFHGVYVSYLYIQRLCENGVEVRVCPICQCVFIIVRTAPNSRLVIQTKHTYDKSINDCAPELLVFRISIEQIKVCFVGG